MPLLINIRQAAKKNLVLHGEIALADMEWDTHDEMIHVTHPLRYSLEIQKIDKGLLVQGSVQQILNCDCVRCLKSFIYEVNDPNWSYLLELDGEEKVPVINDCVDLTPYIREDIFLAFPQHPLCDPQCDGLATMHQDKPSADWESNAASAVWDKLNKLKL